MGLVLIRLVNMGFNRMFSNPHCRYTQALQVGLVLIRLVNMGFNRMLSNHHCRYTGPTCGSSFNQIVIGLKLILVSYPIGFFFTQTISDGNISSNINVLYVVLNIKTVFCFFSPYVSFSPYLALQLIQCNNLDTVYHLNETSSKR